MPTAIRSAMIAHYRNSLLLPLLVGFFALYLFHPGLPLQAEPVEERSIPDDIAAMEPHALAVEVRALFERSCAECHDPEYGRPRGGFGNVLELEEMTAEGFLVEPGDPNLSDIYLVLFDPDPNIVMPPPDSGQPALDDREIAMVAQWILNGAGMPPAPAATLVALADDDHTPTDAPPADVADTPEITDAQTAPTPAVRKKKEEEPRVIDPMRVFAKLHPLIIHFPIALLMVAALTEFLGIFRPSLDLVSRWSVWIATLAAIPSAVTGWLLVPIAGWGANAMFLHRWLGVSTAVGCVVALVVLELAIGRRKTALRWTARLIIWGLAILVSLTGHTGGELVHGKDFLFR